MRDTGVLSMMKLDWLGMRKYRSKLVIATALACVMGILIDPIVILPYMVFGMFDASLYCFDAEERGKLNQLYLTLPISRGTLISARYLLSLILQLIGIAAGIVLTLVIALILRSSWPSPQTMALLTCGSLLFCACLSLMIHPMLHKFGYAKAKVIGYALPLFLMGGLLLIFFLAVGYYEPFAALVNPAFLWMAQNTALTSLLVLCLTALLLAASYKLSQRVYAKREF